MNKTLRERALELYSLSPLKQRKVERLRRFLGTLRDERCLDLGSDNGVVSLLLRSEGGTWSSADLSPETVEAIRALVTERVFQTDGTHLPGDAGSYDVVAVVDMLEHLSSDQLFARELARVLRPGGVLIVNVPNPIPGFIRSFRLLCGQTDERHGHVRAGYSRAQLEELLKGNFELERAESYGRVFSEIVDFLITGALDLLKRGARGVKGQVVSVKDVRSEGSLVKLYRLLYPILKLMVLLDELLPGKRGNMLIAKFVRTGAPVV